MESGAQGRNRTTDTMIFSHVLYQLSYLGIWRELDGRPWCDAPELVRLDGRFGARSVYRQRGPNCPALCHYCGAPRNWRAAGAIAGWWVSSSASARCPSSGAAPHLALIVAMRRT